MKIEQIKNFETKSIGDIDSIEAKIDAGSMPFLFEMMSKSLYSNPIGSIVREITSNCFDSHQEAKIDDAVVIVKGEDEDGHYISFNDYGVGLSPERIRKVYMNYFSSTKRDTNDQIGGFGLGSKTPLSYVDFFFITTNYEGTKYQYVLSKGEKSPTLDLMDESSTKDRNGTEIKIYIEYKKDEYARVIKDDVTRFERELKTQLCYFDNVYFQGWNIENDYRIYDLKYFKYRNQDQYSDEMHIILGKVSYPIDWKEIGEKPIKIPIGVKFDIGELVVTPNRETLRYTDEVKTIVKERVKLALAECIELFQSQNKTIDNYFEWFELKNTRPFINFISPVIDGELGYKDKLYLSGVEQIPKKYKCSILQGLPFLEKEDLLSKLYYNVGAFYNRKVNKDFGNSLTPNSSRASTYIGDTKVIKEEFAYYFIRGEVFRPIKLDLKYLRHNQDSNHIFIEITDLEKDKRNKQRERDGLNLIQADRGKSTFGNEYTYFKLGIALKIYNALKTIRQQSQERWNNYRELTVDEKAQFKAWKDENNANLQRKLAGKVLVKDMARYSKAYDWKVNNTYKYKKILQAKINTSCQFPRKYATKKIINECGIDFYKGIIVYGFRDDTHKLNKAVTFLGQFKTLREEGTYCIDTRSAKVIQISQQNEKYFKGKANMVHVDQLYTDNKLFRQLASSIKIENYFIELNSHRISDTEQFIDQIDKICSPVAEYMRTLYRYYKETSSNEISGSEIKRKDLKDEILEIATKLNLFDHRVETIFTQLDNWFTGVEIIKFTDITDQSLPFIIKLLGDNKKKLNLEYYQTYIEKYKIDNIQPYQVGPHHDRFYNRAKIIQQTIQFEDIEEKTNKTKFKILTNAA